jgi:hypothetical protein
MGRICIISSHDRMFIPFLILGYLDHLHQYYLHQRCRYRCLKTNLCCLIGRWYSVSLMLQHLKNFETRTGLLHCPFQLPRLLVRHDFHCQLCFLIDCKSKKSYVQGLHVDNYLPWTAKNIHILEDHSITIPNCDYVDKRCLWFKNFPILLCHFGSPFLSIVRNPRNWKQKYWRKFQG